MICEKPLTAISGTPGDEEPIGDKVPKRVMYLKMLEQIRYLRTVIKKTRQEVHVCRELRVCPLP